jgi:hypothetical protein
MYSGEECFICTERIKKLGQSIYFLCYKNIPKINHTVIFQGNRSDSEQTCSSFHELSGAV